MLRQALHKFIQVLLQFAGCFCACKNVNAVLICFEEEVPWSKTSDTSIPPHTNKIPISRRSLKELRQHRSTVTLKLLFYRPGTDGHSPWSAKGLTLFLTDAPFEYCTRNGFKMFQNTACTKLRVIPERKTLIHEGSWRYGGTKDVLFQEFARRHSLVPCQRLVLLPMKPEVFGAFKILGSWTSHEDVFALSIALCRPSMTPELKQTSSLRQDLDFDDSMMWRKQGRSIVVQISLIVLLSIGTHMQASGPGKGFAVSSADGQRSVVFGSRRTRDPD